MLVLASVMCSLVCFLGLFVMIVGGFNPVVPILMIAGGFFGTFICLRLNELEEFKR